MSDEEKYDYLTWARQDIGNNSFVSAQACALVALTEAVKELTVAVEKIQTHLERMTKTSQTYDNHNEVVDIEFLRIWMGYD